MAALLGLSLAAAGNGADLRAVAAEAAAGVPTRTDPQGTIGGGVGEFGGPPGPGPAAEAPSAQNRGADQRQDRNAGQRPEKRRLGSCRP